MIIWINFVTNPETELMCFKFSLLGPLSSAIGYLYCLHFFSQKNNPPKWGWDFYIILIKNGVFALTESWKTKEKRRTFYFIWNIFTSQLQSVQENIGNFFVPCVSFTWKRGRRWGNFLQHNQELAHFWGFYSTAFRT